MGKNKKRVDDEIELDDEFLNDDEIEDIDDLEEIEDIDDEDLEVEDEIEDEEPSKKSKNNSKSKGKKKGLGAGAKAAIAIPSVLVGLAAIVLVFLFVIMPLISPEATISNNTDIVLSKSGYQRYIDDVSTVQLKKDATFDHIVSVDEMLKATGLSVSKKSDQIKIAANLYNLATTNYANLANTSWYCYTDSSVYAKNVEAKMIGQTFKFPEFNVGVRAAYMLSQMETTAAGNLGEPNEYSSTISGVTKLDIAGLPSSLTGTLKGLFGYNVQNVLYDGTYCFRKGTNGGAQFYGEDDLDENGDCLGLKYAMGAYNANFPTKLNSKLNSDKSKPEKYFDIHPYSEDDNVAVVLDYIETPQDVTSIRKNAWDPLDKHYTFAYKLDVYGKTYNYYCGNFGTGWAVYDFSEDNLDSSTTVTYDKASHVYTVKIAVKKDRMNDACLFAKGTLTKDTKDYIKMQDPTYSLVENTIQIFDNGLIKSWYRDEKVESEQEAELAILTGTCKNGGGTENVTQQAYSYDLVDCNPLACAKLYWPELDKNSVAGSKGFDLSSYTALKDYKPTANK